MLAGHGYIGLLYDKGFALNDFVDYMLETAKQKSHKVRKAMADPITQHQILVIKKDGRRGILKTEALTKRLTKTYPHANVLCLDPSRLSLMDQIELAQRTTVLLTPPGGVSYFAFFLRARATAVFTGVWHPGSKKGYILEVSVWEYFNRITSLYYDIKNEAEVTIEAPGNTTRRSDGDFRDYGAVTLDPARIMPLMASAVSASGSALGLKEEVRQSLSAKADQGD
jgi:hypothetical protein